MLCRQSRGMRIRMSRFSYGANLALTVISSACGGPQDDLSERAQTTTGIEATSKPNSVVEIGWVVHETTDAMTGTVSKSARVAGTQEDGSPAILTFMCDPRTPDFEIVLVDTTAYLGSSGSNVGYRIDGGEPSYVSAMGNSSPHGISIVNKPELIEALKSGGDEIVMQLIAHQLVMTFPLEDAASAIDEVKASCRAS